MALSSLFAISMTTSDFGASFLGLGAALAGALGAQALGTWATTARWEWKSAVITSLSLSILLRAADPIWWAAAGAIGIGAKFAIRYKGKHIWNPACLGIVAVTLATSAAWFSPGQWGQTPWFGALAIGFAALVLSSAKRLDIALGFLGAFALMLFGRALYLGDPVAIPLHQLQSGALLVFAFFMITDPRSTPDSRAGRLIFAAAVAALAAWLSWGPHVRGGMLYALAILAPLTPLLDRLLPAGRFTWTSSRKGRTDEPETLPERRGAGPAVAAGG
ncbi:MAG: RnfABCDGE type electron transport complex subunit D [Pseudomonadota bacterium]